MVLSEYMLSAWFVSMWLKGVFTNQSTLSLTSVLFEVVSRLVIGLPVPPMPGEPRLTTLAQSDKNPNKTSALVADFQTPVISTSTYVETPDLTAPNPIKHNDDFPNLPEFCVPIHHNSKTPLSLEANMGYFSEPTGKPTPVAAHNTNKVLSQHLQAMLSRDVALLQVLVDTGASVCITHERNDFTSPLILPDKPMVIGGLAHGLAMEGKGTVDWTFLMDDGHFWTVSLEAYYVPQGGRRLLSPQTIDQQLKTGATFSIDGETGTLSLKNLHTGHTSSVTANLDKRTNLPLYSCINGRDLSQRRTELNICIADEANQNLAASQKELLKWHFRLGHLNYTAVQMLLRGGFLGDTSLQKAAANCEHPKCSSCQYGKGRRRPSQSEITKPVPSKEGSLKTEDLFPGQTVSVDHFQSSAKGRLYESFGKTSEDKMYSGGSIFVDHATGYIHVEHQVSWSAAEMIAAKHRYERHMLDMGVTVVSYQSDNGTFGAAAFIKELLIKNQHST
jgi:hypothetical protein